MEPTPVRVLVVGDENVGKTTLIQALCGASSLSRERSSTRCAISVRLTEDSHFQQFYDLPGSRRFRYGRHLVYTHCRFDCVLFVYDLTDPSTRSSVSCSWVPEVMTVLGDVGAIETGGRLDGHEVHVRSSGVISELRFLWRQALLSHSTVSPVQALSEAVRLSWRLARLLLNETSVWSDQAIDFEAERLYLSTSTVPTAIVGMKADLIDREDLLDGEPVSRGKSVPHLKLHSNSVAHDTGLQGFLRQVGDSVKRKTPRAPHRLAHRQGSGLTFGLSQLLSTVDDGGLVNSYPS